MTLTHPITRVCKCCGEFWIPLPGDTAATCLKCDLEFLRVEFERHRAAIEPKALSETNL